MIEEKEVMNRPRQKHTSSKVNGSDFKINEVVKYSDDGYAHNTKRVFETTRGKFVRTKEEQSAGRGNETISIVITQKTNVQQKKKQSRREEENPHWCRKPENGPCPVSTADYLKILAKNCSTPDVNKEYVNRKQKKKSSCSDTHINKINPIGTNFIVNTVTLEPHTIPLNCQDLLKHPLMQAQMRIYRCHLGSHEEKYCQACNSDAFFDVLKGLYDCYTNKNCVNCNCILCSSFHKAKRKLLLGEVSRSKVSVGVETVATKHRTKETLKKTKDHGLFTSLTGKPTEQKETNIAAVSKEPLSTQLEKLRKAQASGILPTLEGYSSIHREKTSNAIIQSGSILYGRKRTPDNKVINQVRKELGLPLESRPVLENERDSKSISLGNTALFEKKSQKETILRAVAGKRMTSQEAKPTIGLNKKMPHDTRAQMEKMQRAQQAGLLTPNESLVFPDSEQQEIRLTHGKTLSERKLIDKIRKELGLTTPLTKSALAKIMKPILSPSHMSNFSPVTLEKKRKTYEKKSKITKEGKGDQRMCSFLASQTNRKTESKTVSPCRITFETVKAAETAGLFSQLQGKSQSEKEKVIRRLANQEIPFPEAKTQSEKKIANKIRAQLGLPPAPSTKSTQTIKSEKVKAQSLITQAEGTAIAQKKKNRSTIEAAEYNTPYNDEISRKVKSASVIAPLKGETPEQRALRKLKATSSKLTEEPSDKSHVQRMTISKTKGLVITPERKSQYAKEKMLRRLAKSGLPLPEGRTASDKELIKRIRTEVVLPLETITPSLKEKLSVARTTCNRVPLENKLSMQAENIIKRMSDTRIQYVQCGRPKENTKGVRSMKTGTGHVRKPKGVVTQSVAVINKDHGEKDMIKGTCEMGCGCDKKKIRFKHSYVKIRVTSPDTSSFCSCPYDCLGVRSGAFADSEGIKVTVETATGLPSYQVQSATPLKRTLLQYPVSKHSEEESHDLIYSQSHISLEISSVESDYTTDYSSSTSIVYIYNSESDVSISDIKRLLRESIDSGDFDESIQDYRQREKPVSYIYQSRLAISRADIKRNYKQTAQVLCPGSDSSSGSFYYSIETVSSSSVTDSNYIRNKLTFLSTLPRNIGFSTDSFLLQRSVNEEYYDTEYTESLVKETDLVPVDTLLRNSRYLIDSSEESHEHHHFEEDVAIYRQTLQPFRSKSLKLQQVTERRVMRTKKNVISSTRLTGSSSIFVMVSTSGIDQAYSDQYLETMSKSQSSQNIISKARAWMDTKKMKLSRFDIFNRKRTYLKRNKQKCSNEAYDIKKSVNACAKAAHKMAMKCQASAGKMKDRRPSQALSMDTVRDRMRYCTTDDGSKIESRGSKPNVISEIIQPMMAREKVAQGLIKDAYMKMEYNQIPSSTCYPSDSFITTGGNEVRTEHFGYSTKPDGSSQRECDQHYDNNVQSNDWSNPVHYSAGPDMLTPNSEISLTSTIYSSIGARSRGCVNPALYTARRQTKQCSDDCKSQKSTKKAKSCVCENSLNLKLSSSSFAPPTCASKKPCLKEVDSSSLKKKQPRPSMDTQRDKIINARDSVTYTKKKCRGKKSSLKKRGHSLHNAQSSYTQKDSNISTNSCIKKSFSQDSAQYRCSSRSPNVDSSGSRYDKHYSSRHHSKSGHTKRSSSNDSAKPDYAKRSHSHHSSRHRHRKKGSPYAQSSYPKKGSYHNSMDSRHSGNCSRHDSMGSRHSGNCSRHDSMGSRHSGNCSRHDSMELRYPNMSPRHGKVESCHQKKFSHHDGMESRYPKKYSYHETESRHRKTSPPLYSMDSHNTQKSSYGSDEAPYLRKGSPAASTKSSHSALPRYGSKNSFNDDVKIKYTKRYYLRETSSNDSVSYLYKDKSYSQDSLHYHYAKKHSPYGSVKNGSHNGSESRIAKKYSDDNLKSCCGKTTRDCSKPHHAKKNSTYDNIRSSDEDKCCTRHGGQTATSDHYAKKHSPYGSYSSFNEKKSCPHNSTELRRARKYSDDNLKSSCGERARDCTKPHHAKKLYPYGSADHSYEETCCSRDGGESRHAKKHPPYDSVKHSAEEKCCSRDGGQTRISENNLKSSCGKRAHDCAKNYHRKKDSPYGSVEPSSEETCCTRHGEKSHNVNKCSPSDSLKSGDSKKCCAHHGEKNDSRNTSHMKSAHEKRASQISVRSSAGRCHPCDNTPTYQKKYSCHNDAEKYRKTKKNYSPDNFKPYYPEKFHQHDTTEPCCPKKCTHRDNVKPSYPKSCSHHDTGNPCCQKKSSHQGREMPCCQKNNSQKDIKQPGCHKRDSHQDILQPCCHKKDSDQDIKQPCNKNKCCQEDIKKRVCKKKCSHHDIGKPCPQKQCSHQDMGKYCCQKRCSQHDAGEPCCQPKCSHEDIKKPCCQNKCSHHDANEPPKPKKSLQDLEQCSHHNARQPCCHQKCSHQDIGKPCCQEKCSHHNTKKPTKKNEQSCFQKKCSHHDAGQPCCQKKCSHEDIGKPCCQIKCPHHDDVEPCKKKKCNVKPSVECCYKKKPHREASVESCPRQKPDCSASDESENSDIAKVCCTRQRVEPCLQRSSCPVVSAEPCDSKTEAVQPCVPKSCLQKETKLKERGKSEETVVSCTCPKKDQKGSKQRKSVFQRLMSSVAGKEHLDVDQQSSRNKRSRRDSMSGRETVTSLKDSMTSTHSLIECQKPKTVCNKGMSPLCKRPVCCKDDGYSRTEKSLSPIKIEAEKKIELEEKKETEEKKDEEKIDKKDSETKKKKKVKEKKVKEKKETRTECQCPITDIINNVKINHDIDIDTCCPINRREPSRKSRRDTPDESCLTKEQNAMLHVLKRVSEYLKDTGSIGDCSCNHKEANNEKSKRKPTDDSRKRYSSTPRAKEDDHEEPEEFDKSRRTSDDPKRRTQTRDRDEVHGCRKPSCVAKKCKPNASRNIYTSPLDEKRKACGRIHGDCKNYLKTRKAKNESEVVTKITDLTEKTSPCLCNSALFERMLNKVMKEACFSPPAPCGRPHPQTHGKEKSDPVTETPVSDKDSPGSVEESSTPVQKLMDIPAPVATKETSNLPVETSPGLAPEELRSQEVEVEKSPDLVPQQPAPKSMPDAPDVVPQQQPNVAVSHRSVVQSQHFVHPAPNQSSYNLSRQKSNTNLGPISMQAPAFKTPDLVGQSPVVAPKPTASRITQQNLNVPLHPTVDKTIQQSFNVPAESTGVRLTQRKHNAALGTGPGHSPQQFTPPAYPPHTPRMTQRLTTTAQQTRAAHAYRNFPNNMSYHHFAVFSRHPIRNQCPSHSAQVLKSHTNNCRCKPSDKNYQINIDSVSEHRCRKNPNNLGTGKCDPPKQKHDDFAYTLSCSGCEPVVAYNNSANIRPLLFDNNNQPDNSGAVVSCSTCDPNTNVPCPDSICSWNNTQPGNAVQANSHPGSLTRNFSNVLGANASANNNNFSNVCSCAHTHDKTAQNQMPDQSYASDCNNACKPPPTDNTYRASGYASSAPFDHNNNCPSNNVCSCKYVPIDEEDNGCESCLQEAIRKINNNGPNEDTRIMCPEKSMGCTNVPIKNPSVIPRQYNQVVPRYKVSDVQSPGSRIASNINKTDNACKCEQPNNTGRTNNSQTSPHDPYERKTCGSSCTACKCDRLESNVHPGSITQPENCLTEKPRRCSPCNPTVKSTMDAGPPKLSLAQIAKKLPRTASGTVICLDRKLCERLLSPCPCGIDDCHCYLPDYPIRRTTNTRCSMKNQHGQICGARAPVGRCLQREPRNCPLSPICGQPQLAPLGGGCFQESPKLQTQGPIEDPNYQPMGPQVQTRQGNDQLMGQQGQMENPNYQPMGPQVQTREGNYQPMGPQVQTREGNYQTMGQQGQREYPNYQPMGPQVQFREGNYQTMGQHVQMEDPNYQPMGPQVQFREGNYQTMGQHVQMEDPNYQPMGPLGQESSYPPMGPLGQNEDPNYQPMGPQVQIREVNYPTMGTQGQSEYSNYQPWSPQGQTEVPNYANWGPQAQQQAGQEPNYDMIDSQKLNPNMQQEITGLDENVMQTPHVTMVGPDGQVYDVRQGAMVGPNDRISGPEGQSTSQQQQANRYYQIDPNFQGEIKTPYDQMLNPQGHVIRMHQQTVSPRQMTENHPVNQRQLKNVPQRQMLYPRQLIVKGPSSKTTQNVQEPLRSDILYRTNESFNLSMGAEGQQLSQQMTRTQGQIVQNLLQQTEDRERDEIITTQAFQVDKKDLPVKTTQQPEGDINPSQKECTCQTKRSCFNQKVWKNVPEPCPCGPYLVEIPAKPKKCSDVILQIKSFFKRRKTKSEKVETNSSKSKKTKQDEKVKQEEEEDEEEETEEGAKETEQDDEAKSPTVQIIYGPQGHMLGRYPDHISGRYPDQSDHMAGGYSERTVGGFTDNLAGGYSEYLARGNMDYMRGSYLDQMEEGYAGQMDGGYPSQMDESYPDQMEGDYPDGIKGSRGQMNGRYYSISPLDAIIYGPEGKMIGSSLGTMTQVSQDQLRSRYNLLLDPQEQTRSQQGQVMYPTRGRVADYPSGQSSYYRWLGSQGQMDFQRSYSGGRIMPGHASRACHEDVARKKCQRQSRCSSYGRKVCPRHQLAFYPYDQATGCPSHRFDENSWNNISASCLCRPTEDAKMPCQGTQYYQYLAGPMAAGPQTRYMKGPQEHILDDNRRNMESSQRQSDQKQENSQEHLDRNIYQQEVSRRKSYVANTYDIHPTMSGRPTPAPKGSRTLSPEALNANPVVPRTSLPRGPQVNPDHSRPGPFGGSPMGPRRTSTGGLPTGPRRPPTSNPPTGPRPPPTSGPPMGSRPASPGVNPMGALPPSTGDSPMGPGPQVQPMGPRVQAQPMGPRPPSPRGSQSRPMDAKTKTPPLEAAQAKPQTKPKAQTSDGSYDKMEDPVIVQYEAEKKRQESEALKTLLIKAAKCSGCSKEMCCSWHDLQKTCLRELSAMKSNLARSTSGFQISQPKRPLVFCTSSHSSFDSSEYSSEEDPACSRVKPSFTKTLKKEFFRKKKKGKDKPKSPSTSDSDQVVVLEDDTFKGLKFYLEGKGGDSPGLSGVFCFNMSEIH